MAARPGTVVEGALPADAVSATLPAVDDLTTTGFADLIDRGIGLFCLAMLLPTIASAYEQLGNVDRVWLAVLGGTVVATSFLMPLYAWSRRGIRRLAGLYAAAVLAGLASWPLAWQSPAPSSSPPLLWMTLGLAVVCSALAAGLRVATVVGLATALLYFWVRLTPAGGAVSPLHALQDAVMVVLQPAAVLLILHYLRGAVANLDAALARGHAENADAAVNQALIDERRRLDAIVHDEVMTTLVAGAQSRTPHDPHVAEQARQALESLRVEALPDPRDTPASADQLVRLIKDVTASVCPRVEVVGEIPAASLTIPQDVVRVLMQAAREAALNAEKHSAAARVRALVHVSATGRRVTVRVTLTDDGRGFDPEAVPPERLGIRLALRGRMKSIGGRAEVASAIGRGTTIRLLWSGERTRHAEPRPRTLVDVGEHPLFKDLDPRPIVIVGTALTVLYGIVGLSVLPALAHPTLSIAGMLLLSIALARGMPWLLDPPLSALRSWFLVCCAVAAAALCVYAMAGGPWPDHGTWFAAPVMVLLVIAYAGGRPTPAWVGAAAVTLVVTVAGLLAGQPLSRLLVAAVTPGGWLAVEALLFFWLDAMWGQLDEAERSADESAALNASMFSLMVLREVWLTELRSEVGPMLTHLADSSRPLTAADKEGFLLMESSLRDGIKASNFNSPGLAAAIMDARTRGVTVTLVDNRGSRLPEAARRVTLRHLEDAVRATASGRVVARTAPEGYDDAVTILQVVAPGETLLTRISGDGTIATGVPQAATE